MYFWVTPVRRRRPFWCLADSFPGAGRGSVGSRRFTYLLPGFSPAGGGAVPGCPRRRGRQGGPGTMSRDLREQSLELTPSVVRLSRA